MSAITKQDKPTSHKLTDSQQAYIAAINESANKLISLYVTDILVDGLKLEVTPDTRFALKQDGTIEVLDGKDTESSAKS